MKGISLHIAENGKSWSYKYGKLHPGCYRCELRRKKLQTLNQQSSPWPSRSSRTETTFYGSNFATQLYSLSPLFQYLTMIQPIFSVHICSIYREKGIVFISSTEIAVSLSRVTRILVGSFQFMRHELGRHESEQNIKELH